MADPRVTLNPGDTSDLRIGNVAVPVNADEATPRQWILDRLDNGTEFPTEPMAGAGFVLISERSANDQVAQTADGSRTIFDTGGRPVNPNSPLNTNTVVVTVNGTRVTNFTPSINEGNNNRIRITFDTAPTSGASIFVQHDAGDNTPGIYFRNAANTDWIPAASGTGATINGLAGDWTVTTGAAGSVTDATRTIVIPSSGGTGGSALPLWAPTTPYMLNSVFFTDASVPEAFRNKIYRVVTAIDNSHTTFDDMVQGSIVVIGEQNTTPFRGQWAGNTDYVIGDIVFELEVLADAPRSFWIALNDVNSTTIPSEDSINWRRIDGGTAGGPGIESVTTLAGLTTDANAYYFLTMAETDPTEGVYFPAGLYQRNSANNGWIHEDRFAGRFHTIPAAAGPFTNITIRTGDVVNQVTNTRNPDGPVGTFIYTGFFGGNTTDATPLPSFTQNTGSPLQAAALESNFIRFGAPLTDSTPLNVWASGVTYAANDQVLRIPDSGDPGIYYALETTLNQPPESNSAVWRQVGGGSSVSVNGSSVSDPNFVNQDAAVNRRTEFVRNGSDIHAVVGPDSTKQDTIDSDNAAAIRTTLGAITQAEARTSVSATTNTTATPTGAFSYDSATGVFTYTNSRGFNSQRLDGTALRSYFGTDTSGNGDFVVDLASLADIPVRDYATITERNADRLITTTIFASVADDTGDDSPNPQGSNAVYILRQIPSDIATAGTDNADWRRITAPDTILNEVEVGQYRPFLDTDGNPSRDPADSTRTNTAADTAGYIYCEGGQLSATSGLTQAVADARYARQALNLSDLDNLTEARGTLRQPFIYTVDGDSNVNGIVPSNNTQAGNILTAFDGLVSRADVNWITTPGDPNQADHPLVNGNMIATQTDFGLNSAGVQFTQTSGTTATNVQIPVVSGGTFSGTSVTLGRNTDGTAPNNSITGFGTAAGSTVAASLSDDGNLPTTNQVNAGLNHVHDQSLSDLHRQRLEDHSNVQPVNVNGGRTAFAANQRDVASAGSDTSNRIDNRTGFRLSTFDSLQFVRTTNGAGAVLVRFLGTNSEWSVNDTVEYQNTHGASLWTGVVRGVQAADGSSTVTLSNNDTVTLEGGSTGHFAVAIEIDGSDFNHFVSNSSQWLQSSSANNVGRGPENTNQFFFIEERSSQDADEYFEGVAMTTSPSHLNNVVYVYQQSSDSWVAMEYGGGGGDGGASGDEWPLVGGFAFGGLGASNLAANTTAYFWSSTNPVYSSGANSWVYETGSGFVMQPISTSTGVARNAAGGVMFNRTGSSQVVRRVDVDINVTQLPADNEASPVLTMDRTNAERTSNTNLGFVNYSLTTLGRQTITIVDGSDNTFANGEGLVLVFSEAGGAADTPIQMQIENIRVSSTTEEFSRVSQGGPFGSYTLDSTAPSGRFVFPAVNPATNVISWTDITSYEGTDNAQHQLNSINFDNTGRVLTLTDGSDTRNVNLAPTAAEVNALSGLTLNNPALGAATATTAAVSTDTTQVATTSFVHEVVDVLPVTNMPSQRQLIGANTLTYSLVFWRPHLETSHSATFRLQDIDIAGQSPTSIRSTDGTVVTDTSQRIAVPVVNSEFTMTFTQGGINAIRSIASATSSHTVDFSVRFNNGQAGDKTVYGITTGDGNTETHDNPNQITLTSPNGSHTATIALDNNNQLVISGPARVIATDFQNS